MIMADTWLLQIFVNGIIKLFIVNLKIKKIFNNP